MYHCFIAQFWCSRDLGTSTAKTSENLSEKNNNNNNNTGRGHSPKQQQQQTDDRPVICKSNQCSTHLKETDSVSLQTPTANYVLGDVTRQKVSFCMDADISKGIQSLCSTPITRNSTTIVNTSINTDSTTTRTTPATEILEKKNALQKSKAAKLNRYMNNLELYGNVSPVTVMPLISPKVVGSTPLTSSFKAPGLRRRFSFGGSKGETNTVKKASLDMRKSSDESGARNSDSNEISAFPAKGLKLGNDDNVNTTMSSTVGKENTDSDISKVNLETSLEANNRSQNSDEKNMARSRKRKKNKKSETGLEEHESSPCQKRKSLRLSKKQ